MFIYVETFLIFFYLMNCFQVRQREIFNEVYFKLVFFVFSLPPAK